jgi:dethiobiotin synthetase
MKKTLFVSGIGTEVGKTVVSATLVQALQADYWKPVQSGDLNYTDTDKIKEWSKDAGETFPEAYRLNIPASPHYSARMDGVNIELNAFELPVTEQPLIVEGAGGLLVPLNNTDTVLDLIKKLDVPLIMVSRAYLGSINHTLLSLEKVKAEGIILAALVFTGERNHESENIIRKHFPEVEGKVLWVENMEEVNQENVSRAAKEITNPLKEILNELD